MNLIRRAGSAGHLAWLFSALLLGSTTLPSCSSVLLEQAEAWGSEAPAESGVLVRSSDDSLLVAHASADDPLRISGGAFPASGQAAGDSEEMHGDEKTEASDTPEPTTTRLRTYKAKLAILVANLESARGTFLARVEAAGGYLDLRQASTVRVRVPAVHFEEVLASLREAGNVLDETIEARDVTREFFDIEIRLRNAEAARDRLVALLEKAEKVEDVLKIEAEITRLTETIERFKGQLRLLSHDIAWSTIEVTFEANAPAIVSPPPNRWSRFEWINSIGVDRVLEDF